MAAVPHRHGRQSRFPNRPKKALAFLGRLFQKDVNPKSYMSGDGATVATADHAAKQVKKQQQFNFEQPRPGNHVRSHVLGSPEARLAFAFKRRILAL